MCIRDRSFDDIEDFIFEPVQSPAEEMISKEEMAKINDAIQQLPPKCKHEMCIRDRQRSAGKCVD